MPPVTATQAAADMGLPSLNDLNANGAGLPELRLSLHVYDADASRRYVLLNSTRLREGESTPDGIRLERVTETGVILSWRGRRFTIQRGE
jgi:general secretion pathway protein B